MDDVEKLPRISTTLPHTEINILNFTLKGSNKPKSDQPTPNGPGQITPNVFHQLIPNYFGQSKPTTRDYLTPSGFDQPTTNEPDQHKPKEYDQSTSNAFDDPTPNGPVKPRVYNKGMRNEPFRNKRSIIISILSVSL